MSFFGLVSRYTTALTLSDGIFSVVSPQRRKARNNNENASRQILPLATQAFSLSTQLAKLNEIV